jgi:hypothetical protein
MSAGDAVHNMTETTRAERLDNIMSEAHRIWGETNDPTIETLSLLIERLAEEMRNAPELKER